VSDLETRARIHAEPVCTDVFFPVYFPNGSAELTAAARRVIAENGGHARACVLAGVDVVGLPDARDGADPRLALPRERARRLGEALTAAGLPPTAFRLSPLGEAGEAAAVGRGGRPWASARGRVRPLPALTRRRPGKAQGATKEGGPCGPPSRCIIENRGAEATDRAWPVSSRGGVVASARH
jgi:hypothetical protein